MGENISFNKKVFKFNTNNGIAKSDFDNKLNEKQQKLLNSVFGKNFDINQDGVLDASELRLLETAIKQAASGGNKNNMGKVEARNFMQNALGLTGSDLDSLSRDDLFEILDIIQGDSDSIEKAETKDGVTTIKYKDNVPTDDDGRKILSETYTACEKSLIPKSKNYALENGWTEHELYENGTLSSMTRTKGTVTETFDTNNKNRPIQRDTDKGMFTESVKFIYNDEENTVLVETFINDNPEPVSTEVKSIDDLSPDGDSGDDSSDETKIDNNEAEEKPPLIKEVTAGENTGDESPRVNGDEYRKEK